MVSRPFLTIIKRKRQSGTFFLRTESHGYDVSCFEGTSPRRKLSLLISPTGQGLEHFSLPGPFDIGKLPLQLPNCNA